MPIELDVIVLNWNAPEETILCVRAVESWVRFHPTIWVVDNNSSAEDLQAISRACPNVHLICNRQNLGFAGGNNTAIAQALSKGDAPILLLNNDASVDEDSVIRLVTTLHEDGQIGIIGPLLFDAEQKETLLSAGGRNIALHTNSHSLRVDRENPVQETDYVPGTVVLIRPDVFHQVGLLDEDYFFGGEIADLCARAKNRGVTSVIDARARAYHTISRSSGIRETLHVYYVFRNRFLFIRKFLRSWRFALCPFWVTYGLGMSVKAQLSGKPVKARAIRLGLLDGFKGRFGGENERVLRLQAIHEYTSGRG